MADSKTAEIWKDDLLERSKDAAFPETFLVRRMDERRNESIHGSYVINVDAEWGAGKTFFVERFSLLLKASNPQVTGSNPVGVAKVLATFEGSKSELG